MDEVGHREKEIVLILGRCVSEECLQAGEVV